MTNSTGIIEVCVFSHVGFTFLAKEKGKSPISLAVFHSLVEGSTVTSWEITGLQREIWGGGGGGGTQMAATPIYG